MIAIPLTAPFRKSVSLVLFRSPFWGRSKWHRLGRLGIQLLGCYVVVLLGMLALEDRFLFKPTPANQEWLKVPEGLAVEDVALTGATGEMLHGWWTRPTGWEPAQGAMLFLHGQGGNVSQRGKRLLTWRDQLRLAVLIIDYPGYGKSQGRPSEAGCYAAAEAAHDWLTRVARVPGDRIILYGGSLGGAIATDLATHRPYRALVLVSTFTSFPDMAQTCYPWLPGRWLVHNRMDTLSKIATLNKPVFIAHGTADGFIPFRQAERLFAAANEPRCFFPMPGWGHSEFPCDSFFPALQRFLDDISTPAGQAHWT